MEEPSRGHILNRNSPIPLYHQLFQVLERRIRAGTWQSTHSLPSEAELCQLYGVSRTVVRQAMEDLERAGVIYRVKGRGAFLAERKIIAHMLQDAGGFQANLAAQGLTVQTRVLRQSVLPAPADIAAALQIASGAHILHVERLRSVAEEPVFLGDSYLPVEVCGDLSDEDFAAQSLNDILARRCGLRPAGGRRVIEAVAADRHRAELLQVSVGAPLFQLLAVTCAQSGRPMECSRVWLRGDRAAFEVNLEHSASFD